MCLANPPSNFEVRGEALNPKTTHTHTLSLLQNTHMCKPTRIPAAGTYTCCCRAIARMNAKGSAVLWSGATQMVGRGPKVGRGDVLTGSQLSWQVFFLFINFFF